MRSNPIHGRTAGHSNVTPVHQARHQARPHNSHPLYLLHLILLCIKSGKALHLSGISSFILAAGSSFSESFIDRGQQCTHTLLHTAGCTGCHNLMGIASHATLILWLGLVLLLGCSAQTGPFCEQLCLSAGWSWIFTWMDLMQCKNIITWLLHPDSRHGCRQRVHWSGTVPRCILQCRLWQLWRWHLHHVMQTWDADLTRHRVP